VLQKVRNVLVLVGLAFVVVAGVFAQQRGPASSAPSLSPQDWIEIYQLYGRYTHLIDNGQDKGYAYARLWTEDAIFEFGGQKHQGPDALAKVAMLGISDPPILRPNHYAHNIVIEPSAEGATGKAYLVMMAANKPGEPHTVTTRGIYEDRFVKTPTGWKFKHRKFTPAATSNDGNTRTSFEPAVPPFMAQATR
jgi:hypothetical protein